MLSFGNAKIYINDFMYFGTLQNSKLLTTDRIWWRETRLGYLFWSSTSLENTPGQTCLTPASWL